MKFDGFRTQLHKAGQTAWIFGKNGGDLTRRFPTIGAEILALLAKSFIIDGELIAAGAHGISWPCCTAVGCRCASMPST